MYKKVSVLLPMLHAAYAQRSPQPWPAFDGSYLDRGEFVTASEVGKCARMVHFAKTSPKEGNGVPTAWGFFERGHSHEAWIVDCLRALRHDSHWTYIGKDQVSFFHGNQSGTPDGLLQHDGQLWIVDFKSIDPRTKLSNLPKPEHIDQVLQNADLVEACLDVDIDGALLAYSDASDYAKINEYLIDCNLTEARVRMQYLEDRANSIMLANKPEDLPAEGIYNGGCKYCDFTAQCSAAIEMKNVERVKHDTARQRANAIFGKS